jgi:hypothetical protein
MSSASPDVGFARGGRGRWPVRDVLPDDAHATHTGKTQVAHRPNRELAVRNAVMAAVELEPLAADPAAVSKRELEAEADPDTVGGGLGNGSSFGASAGLGCDDVVLPEVLEEERPH